MSGSRRHPVSRTGEKRQRTEVFYCGSYTCHWVERNASRGISSCFTKPGGISSTSLSIISVQKSQDCSIKAIVVPALPAPNTLIFVNQFLFTDPGARLERGTAARTGQQNKAKITLYYRCCLGWPLRLPTSVWGISLCRSTTGSEMVAASILLQGVTVDRQIWVADCTISGKDFLKTGAACQSNLRMPAITV